MSSGLPAEIASDILTRLPVRSLARCRAVCKEWSSIINDPRFVTAHLDRTRKTLPPSIAAISLGIAGDTITVLDVVRDPSPTPSKSYPVRPRARLITSCNGIICLANTDGSIELLNPAIRESLTLQPTYRSCSRRLFFGFSPVTNEYKVVSFFCNKGNPITGCEVYTVGTGSWRIIDVPDFYPDALHGGITINGIISWITEGVWDDCTWRRIVDEISIEGGWEDCIIASFDLATEKFTASRFPNTAIYGPGRDRDYFTDNLLEVEGSLCVVVLVPEGIVNSFRWRIDIWGFGDGPGNGWVKKYTFCIPRLGLSSRPLLIHDGNVVMVCICSYGESVPLSMVNLQSGSWREIFTREPCFECLPHAESLTSLRNL